MHTQAGHLQSASLSAVRQEWCFLSSSSPSWMQSPGATSRRPCKLMSSAEGAAPRRAFRCLQRTGPMGGYSLPCRSAPGSSVMATAAQSFSELLAVPVSAQTTAALLSVRMAAQILWLVPKRWRSSSGGGSSHSASPKQPGGRVRVPGLGGS